MYHFLKNINNNTRLLAAAREQVKTQVDVGNCIFMNTGYWTDMTHNLLRLQSWTGTSMMPTPRLGQYFGAVFPSSRVAQSPGVGLGVEGSVPVRFTTGLAMPEAARVRVTRTLWKYMVFLQN
jgi:hypothetical protein